MTRYQTHACFFTLLMPSFAYASVSISAPLPGTTLKAQDVKNLLVETNLEVLSAAPSGAVAEIAPWEYGDFEKSRAGYGQASLIVNGKWATMRHIGPQAAGMGKVSSAQISAAQRAALGTRNDSTPVTTAVHTIDNMMDNYFSPLITQLPGGERKLQNIKIQGAYFSPDSGRSPPEYDNAYIIGLQTLVLLPHSCFSKPTLPECQGTFFSAGHDPTVIGHELGHVIFNHLRDSQGLDGFQWFAINEAYSDYFAASYFNDPKIGRVWKSNLESLSYLRSVLDNPNISDEKLADEVHRYSNALSSALWRIRNKTKTDAKLQTLDSIVLQSIEFLGESERTRLSDAGIALLRAAESLGHTKFKELIRAELQNSGIAMQQSRVVPITKAPRLETQSRCGNIGYQEKKRSFPYLEIIPLILSLLWTMFSAIRRRRA